MSRYALEPDPETDNALSHLDRMARAERPTLKLWYLVWSPEGKRIATVQARTRKAALAQAPKPYNRYRGEIYAELA